MTRPRGGVKISSTKELSTFEKAPPMTKPCYYLTREIAKRRTEEKELSRSSQENEGACVVATEHIYFFRSLRPKEHNTSAKVPFFSLLLLLLFSLLSLNELLVAVMGMNVPLRDR